jgi:hypothetical protein
MISATCATRELTIPAMRGSAHLYSRIEPERGRIAPLMIVSPEKSEAKRSFSVDKIKMLITIVSTLQRRRSHACTNARKRRF